MALVLIDGFDRCATSDDLKKRHTVASSCTIATGRFGTGKCVSVQANNGFALTLATPTLDTMSLGFAFRIKGAALSTAGAGYAFIRFCTGATEICHFSVSATGQLLFGRASVTAPVQTAAGVIADDVWNHVELTWTRNSSTGSATIRVNGAVAASGTGLNLGASSIDNIKILSNTGTTSANDFRQFDDLYLNDAATSLGEARVDVLAPSADTADKDWTPLSGTDNYAMVDEATYDDDTSYVSSSTVGNKDLYDVADLASSPTSILAVQVGYTAKKDDATARTMRSVLKSGVTEAVGTTNAPGSSAYTFFSDIHEVDPGTASAWTASGVNALQVGMEVVS